jgi:4-diphosphocytidyl-2-C-methyl-D-erythritol kinase
MAIEAFAPAKINLTLHVTGRRNDGFHLLDSLVVFADVGDRITAAPAAGLSLKVTGPMARGLPADDENLVMQAARLLREISGVAGRGADLILEKRLPLAAGLGGGSSDAAAALSVLSCLWDVAMPPANLLVRLGSDLPACLSARPLRMTGIGETLAPLSHAMPAVTLLLVNPGVSLPTPAVFAALDRRDHLPMPDVLPPFGNAEDLAAFLGTMRNDLEAAAIRLAPAITEVKSALAAQPGCLIARMSGSGATCFGIFADSRSAESAAGTLRRARPDWWIEPAPVLNANART